MRENVASFLIYLSPTAYLASRRAEVLPSADWYRVQAWSFFFLVT
jgi:hypothetical protein